jgi:hypothetical protein
LKNFFLLIFVLVNIKPALCQFKPGAKEISIANSAVALSNDVFSLFNNPAGLAQLNWREVGIFYSPSPFGLKELANGYAAYNEPFSFGSIAIGGMTYGFNLYKESKIIIGFSHNFINRFFAGFAITYHSFSIKNYGSASTFYLNAGGLAYLTNRLRWGFYFTNINRATVSKSDNQIPMILNTGFSYDVINNMSLNFSFEKDVQYNPELHFGIDYELTDNLSLRSGFSNNPSDYTAGIGLNFPYIELNYAIIKHPDLGLTHQVGLIVTFERVANRYNKIRNYLESK